MHLKVSHLLPKLGHNFRFIQCTLTLKSWSDTESICQLSEDGDTVQDQWVLDGFHHPVF